MSPFRVFSRELLGLVALLALSAAPAVLAQTEASPSPSPTPESTPAATPVPSATPEASPAPGAAMAPAPAAPASTTGAPAVSGTEGGTAAASPTPKPKPVSPYSIEIDITKQHVHLLKDGKEIAVSPISSGRAGKLTPVGNFEIIEKDPNHSSSLYGKFVEKGSGRVVKAGADAAMPVPKGCRFERAPMKWFMRFDGATGMHAGVLPGYPASHGCVRMPPEKAKQFYDLVEIGTPVHVFGEIPAGHEHAGGSSHTHEEHAPRPKAPTPPPAPTPAPRKHWWPF